MCAFLHTKRTWDFFRCAEKITLYDVYIRSDYYVLKRGRPSFQQVPLDFQLNTTVRYLCEAHLQLWVK